MDAIGNDWNTAPACVLSTVWGTASIRDLAVEVGAVPASPIRQVLTSRQAGCAWPQSSARASLWVCGQHKSVAHKPTGTTAVTENLNNLEISSVRTTPGSPSQAALNATMHGCYDLSAIYTRCLIAVHKMPLHTPDLSSSSNSHRSWSERTMPRVKIALLASSSF